VVAEELQLEELVDQAAVEGLGVLPVEVGDRLHGEQLGGGEPTLEAAALAFGLLDVEESARAACLDFLATP
jgi:hypothetical protein